MEGVESLATDMSQEKAREEWKLYCELIKRHPSEHAKALKKAYYALSKGHQIIDIYEAFKSAGKHENDKPRLAIARANLEKVVFARRSNGAGAFFSPGGWEWNPDISWLHGNAFLALPRGIFKDWQQSLWKKSDRPWAEMNVETIVPPIPARYYPDGQLQRYFILWEVEEDGWSYMPQPPGDPMLLRRISPNLFVVLAAWDLTDLEKAVIRGAVLR